MMPRTTSTRTQDVYDIVGLSVTSTSTSSDSDFLMEEFVSPNPVVPEKKKECRHSKSMFLAPKAKFKVHRRKI